MSDRHVPPHRACKREFQASREFGRAVVHRAIVRTREQSPAWQPAVVARPVDVVQVERGGSRAEKEA